MDLHIYLPTFLIGMTVLAALLKAGGFIDWSWGIVLAPILMPTIVIIAIAVIMVTMGVCIAAVLFMVATTMLAAVGLVLGSKDA